MKFLFHEFGNKFSKAHCNGKYSEIISFQWQSSLPERWNDYLEQVTSKTTRVQPCSLPGNLHHHIPWERLGRYTEKFLGSPQLSQLLWFNTYTQNRSNSPFGAWQLAATQQLQDKKGTSGSCCLKCQIASTMFGLLRIQQSQNIKQVPQGQQP